MGPKTESGALKISIFASALVAVVGPLTAWISGSSAILLNGLFNMSYCIAAIFALRVAELLRRGDDEEYPFGYAFFEPLVNIIKGLLMLGIIAGAIYNALLSLAGSGSQIASGIAIAYGVFASIVGLGTAALLYSSAKSLSSPLVDADVKNWVVNGLISAMVLVVFLLIPVLRSIGLETWTPYVDPLLVMLLSLVTIMVPINMTRSALLQMLNRAAPKALHDDIQAHLGEAFAELPVTGSVLRVVRVGRSPMVLYHAVLPPETAISVGELDRHRRAAAGKLRAKHPNIVVDSVFTADPAPL